MINLMFIVLILLLLIILIKYLKLKQNLKNFNFNLSKKIEYNSISKVESYKNKDLIEISNNIELMLKKNNEIKNEFNEIVKEDRELMANISHDLRTPLTSIIGYLSLIEKESNREIVDNYINISKGKAQYLNELINKFYELSLILNHDREIEKEYLNLSEFVYNIAFEYYNTFEKNKESFEVKSYSENVEILTSSSILSNIFHNILDNMVKYSEGDNYIEIKKGENGENIEIIFSNKCTFVKDGEYDYLFNRLTVLDSSRKNSTGIGLAIVKASIDKLGYNGKIYVKDQKFYIKIEIPME